MKHGNDYKRSMNTQTKQYYKTDGRTEGRIVFYCSYFITPLLFIVYFCFHIFIAVTFFTQEINLSTRKHATNTTTLSATQINCMSRESLQCLNRNKSKVQCTLVQALRLCTGRTAHRGSRGIALVFHDQRH